MKINRVVKIGLIVALAFVSSPVSAGSWNDDITVLHQSTEVTTIHRCPSVVYPVAVKEVGGYRDACVHGATTGFRFAQYANNTGHRTYAVAFRYGSESRSLYGVCGVGSMCEYGQAADVLLAHVQTPNGLSLAMIKDFSKHLHLRADGKYELNNTAEWASLMHGTAPARVASMAVSQGGKWAVVEVQRYGFVRINLSTLEYKRVVAPGVEYGYGTDVAHDLAIANDGKTVAIAGRGGGFSMYSITDECGDALTKQSTVNFSSEAVPCPRLAVNKAMFPGATDLYAPHFSDDGNVIDVIVSQSGGGMRVWLGSDASRLHSRYYRALGDSYTSGEGELHDSFYLSSTNTKENRCHVSVRSYPYRVGSVWNIPTQNHACSGARIADTRRELINIGLPSHVSISVGGNDVSLIGKLKTCLGPGTCEWARPETRMSTALEINRLFPRLVELIETTKQHTASAQLAVIGYPRVVNVDKGASCPLIISGLLNHEERMYLDEAIKQLNRVLSAAARYTKVVYIDVQEAFMGEKLCDEPPSSMNSIRLGDDIAPLSFLSNLKVIGAESFHPTPRGHQLVAAIIAASGSEWRSECDSCESVESLLTPSSYWQGGAANTSNQFSETFLSHNETQSGDEVTISFVAGTFKPNTPVSVEIHSTPVVLGGFVSSADGSLKETIVIPDTPAGYHTVHVYGISPSNEAIDVYEVISVDLEPYVPPVGNTNSSERVVSNKSVLTPIGATIAKAKVSTGVVPSTTHEDILGSTHGRVSMNNQPLHAPNQQSRFTPIPWIILGAFIFLSVISLTLFLRRRNNHHAP